VADGGSTDNTVKVIKESHDIVSDWRSELDTGIYQAWNRACDLIKGEWVMFLGAGDILATPATLEQATLALRDMNCDRDFVYGNVVHSAGLLILYRYEEINFCDWQSCRPALPAHQGVFHRATLLAALKPFDESYKVVGDSKFLLTHMRADNTKYIDLDISKMQAGGCSSNPKYVLKVMNEFLRLESDLGYRIPVFRRVLYIMRSHSKFILYKLLGARAVDIVIRAKQRCLRSSV
jgi:glycosyltransferase involved in cell wall biosynthesis